MLFELSIWGALCDTSKFVVNGIEAYKDDFGEQYDRDSGNAEDYACGNMQFTRIAPTKEVLEKYCITEEEYSKICDELESGLSFGCCGWCV
jgi:hypothetical protein